MPTVVDLAICVRQWDWSETSQTVSLFSREHGLIRGVAKGARRPEARFSGGLEVPTLGEIVAIVKTTPVLATLTGWDVRETFPAMRRSLSAFYAGMYGVDLVHHALQERDPHPALFDALLAALRSLGHGQSADLLAAVRFQWAALEQTGFRPDLGHDALTGDELPAASVYLFSPSLGGFLPDRAIDGSGGGRLWRVRAETLHTLRGIATDSAGPDVDSGVLRAGRLLAAYLREILGRDLASAMPLFGSAPV